LKNRKNRQALGANPILAPHDEILAMRLLACLSSGWATTMGRLLGPKV